MRTIILFLFAFSTSLSGQTQEQREWILYKSIEGIEIYFQETDCRTNDAPAQVAYIIKVVNTTGQNLNISWNLIVWYNNERLEKNVADDENHYKVRVDANQTVIGDCTVPYGALYIFKDFITYDSKTKLTRFELENIQIAKI